MFNNSLGPNDEHTNSTNAIGRGTTLTGKLQANGPLRIDGQVVGDVITKSKIVLGDTSIVEGNIIAQSADIGGKVEGKVTVDDMLTLKPSCKINGDIITNRLVVESGAKLSGQCDIGMSGKPATTHQQNFNKPKPEPKNYEKVAEKEIAKTAAVVTSKVEKLKSKLGV